jgi:hypothetical protein
MSLDSEEQMKARQKSSLCQCGHWKASHKDDAECRSPMGRTSQGDWKLCSCSAFKAIAS